MQPPASTIATFYRYKGGVGATTLLANVAWQLASAGKSVLAVDWDLAAPSLHRYYAPFLVDPELTATRGIIDAAFDFATVGTPSPELSSLAVSIDREYPGGGRLDFLAAGCLVPSAAYATRVSGFRWQSFLEGPAGATFLASIQELRSTYQYILIDCAPGIADTTALCTVTLPDVLCLCFSSAPLSVIGARGLAHRALRERSGRPLRVLPLGMRVDPSEKALLDQRRTAARAEMAPLLGPLEVSDLERYWREAEFPYVPYYGFGESLPVFFDSPGDLNSLCTACERLCRRLAPGESLTFSYPSPIERARINPPRSSFT
jgi:hypothetical protein